MKKIRLTILLAMLISMVHTRAFAYDITVANDNGVAIYYNYINNGTELMVTYKDTNYDSYSGAVNIPKKVTYNGTDYNVTSIGHSAFYQCRSMTSITIPNSVTSIGDNAFYDCFKLTSIDIPNSVTSIGDNAFYDCFKLTSIDIPNSVMSIGSYAFDNTVWYDNQPDGLVYAGKVAYKYKGTMPDNTNITLEEGTLGIAGNAFYDCDGLISVTIPNSLKSIGNYAFYGCI